MPKDVKEPKLLDFNKVLNYPYPSWVVRSLNVKIGEITVEKYELKLNQTGREEIEEIIIRVMKKYFPNENIEPTNNDDLNFRFMGMIVEIHIKTEISKPSEIKVYCKRTWLSRKFKWLNIAICEYDPFIQNYHHFIGNLITAFEESGLLLSE